MRRYDKYAVVFAGIAVLLIVWGDRAGAEPEDKLILPDAARKAERLYAQRIKHLRTEFEAQLRQAWKAHVKRLTGLRKTYTAAGDLDGALAIRARIEELQTPPQAAEDKDKKQAKVGLRMDELRGTWMIRWSDGTRDALRFHGRNRVTVGKWDGNLSRKRGELAIVYSTQAIDRITFGEERLFLEHFSRPGKAFPKGDPALMGIARKVE